MMPAEHDDVDDRCPAIARDIERGRSPFASERRVYVIIVIIWAVLLVSAIGALAIDKVLVP